MNVLIKNKKFLGKLKKLISNILFSKRILKRVFYYI